MQTERVEKILHDDNRHNWSQHIAIEAKDPYIESYPALIKAAKHLYECMGEDALIAIAHIAYGWMPTILKNFEPPNEVEKFCERAVKTSSFAEARDIVLELEKSPINNSWVGLSKVLHFMNPEFFPIWDSKVAKHFKAGHKMSDRANYPAYIQFIESQQGTEIVSAVQQLFKEKTDYEVSKARACEFALFTYPPST